MQTDGGISRAPNVYQKVIDGSADVCPELGFGYDECIGDLH